MAENPLGEFLRARRAALRPHDVDMPSYGARRVAGLRREEVAVLAGMNVDYYARLEQGRERHPSAQVLDALTRALRLEPGAAAHLHQLAGVAPLAPPAQAGDWVSPALRQLLDSHHGAPAFVINPTLDVLDANVLAQALHSPFAQPHNLARMTFVDPAGEVFYPRWHHTAQAVVAHLRQAAGPAPDSRRLNDLVEHLSEHSAHFTLLWKSHEVRGKTRDAKDFLHPDVGPLSVTYQAFDVRDAPGQQLVLYQAEPGSPSAQALTLLGTLHSTAHRPAR